MLQTDLAVTEEDLKIVTMVPQDTKIIKKSIFNNIFDHLIKSWIGLATFSGILLGIFGWYAFYQRRINKK